MKNLCTLSALALTISSVPGQSDAYLNTVRQIDQASEFEWDVTVPAKGTRLSREGVGNAGALFQLWSVHRKTAEEYHLDEKFVSAYSPKSTITITTRDPYKVVPRTRVDQPFTVTVQVSGLRSERAAPIESKRLLLKHEVANFPEGFHYFPTRDDKLPTNRLPPALAKTVGTALIEQNRSYTLSYTGSRLPGKDLTKVEGEETWTTSILFDKNVEGEVIQSARLQVWPIASASFSGFKTTETYQEIPTLTLNLNQLYPSSSTYLRFYRGTPDNPLTKPYAVRESFVIINDTVPQSREVMLRGLDALIQLDGSYTFEIVHRTPFGTEILNRLSGITVDRTVRVRSSLLSND